MGFTNLSFVKYKYKLLFVKKIKGLIVELDTKKCQITG